jgi:hypothetical protein
MQLPVQLLVFLLKFAIIYLFFLRDLCHHCVVWSTRNRRAYMRNLMTVEEAKGVCKDRRKWKEVISAYPKGKRA